jgi:hypothetical protein
MSLNQIIVSVSLVFLFIFFSQEEDSVQKITLSGRILLVVVRSQSVIISVLQYLFLVLARLEIVELLSNGKDGRESCRIIFILCKGAPVYFGLQCYWQLTQRYQNPSGETLYNRKGECMSE